MTKRNDICTKSVLALLALAATAIPFTHALSLAIAILIALAFIISNEWKSSIRYLKKSSLVAPIPIFAGLFIAIAIGTAYSQNRGQAFSDWEFKVIFLILPFCLLPFRKSIGIQQLNHILFLFCTATLSVSLINIAISSVHYLQTGDKEQFIYLNASHLLGKNKMHPSYLSMYACLSWVIAFCFLLRKEAETKLRRAVLWTSLFVLPVEIVLLESKAGLLVFGLTFVASMLWLINYRKRRWVLSLLLVGAMAAGGAAGYHYLTKYSKGRLAYAIDCLKNPYYANPYEGTTQRVAIWKTSWELAVEELPWGVGNGDVVDTLCDQYEQRGYTHILARRLNCHNQYLQNLLGMGILGIAVLLAFLGYLLVRGIRRRDFLLLMFAVIIAGNMLVESMLQKHAGADFFCLMGLLLIMRSEKDHADCM